MILGDLIAAVAAKSGFTDAASKAKIASWAKLRYEMLWNGALWKDTLSLYTRTLAANTHTAILPWQVERVLAIKHDATNLLPSDQAFLFNTDPEIWDRAGPAMRFTRPAGIATQTMPATAGELLSLVSSNTADIGKKVSLYGELAGAQKTEIVTLNGTSPVQSVNAYDVAYTLAKGATTGTLTVTGVTSSTQLLQLAPTERARQYPRVRVHETPRQSTDLLILAKRRCNPLVDEADATVLTMLDNALLALTLADTLEWQRQYGKAATKVEEGLALLKEAKTSEFVYQEATAVYLTPADSLGAEVREWE